MDDVLARIQNGESVVLVVGLVMAPDGLNVQITEVVGDELTGDFGEPENFTVPPMILAAAQSMM